MKKLFLLISAVFITALSFSQTFTTGATLATTRGYGQDTAWRYFIYKPSGAGTAGLFMSNGSDTVKIQVGNDTTEFRTTNAWKFVPPLPTGGTTIDTSNFWNINGNAGTTPDSNFIGTTDNVDLYIKRNSIVTGSFQSGGAFNFGDLLGLGEKQKFGITGGVATLQMRRRFEVLDTTTAVLFKVDKAQNRIQLGLNTLPLTDTTYGIGSSSFRLKEIRALRGYFDDILTIADGTQGVDKVFTSDTNGVGSWKHTDSLLPYRKYVALISQSDTLAPVATVLENTLGGTVTWSRADTGMYFATLTGAFIDGKTFVLNNQSSGGNGLCVDVNSFDDAPNMVRFTQFTCSTATDVDGIDKMSVEIRVYK